MYRSAWRLSDPSITVFGTKNEISMPGQSFSVGSMNQQETLLDFGDGTTTYQFVATVLWLDPVEDIVLGRSVFPHVYTDGKQYNATLSLCCRAAGNQNSFLGVKLATTIDLILANRSLRSPGSPMIQAVPLVMIAPGPLLQYFAVPALSAAGAGGRSNLRWALAPPTAYAGSPPPGVAVNSLTGVVAVNSSACAASGVCADIDLILLVADGAARSAVDFTVAFLPAGVAAPTLTLIAPPAPHPLAGASSSVLGGLPPVVAFLGIQVQGRAPRCDLPHHHTTSAPFPTTTAARSRA